MKTTRFPIVVLLAALAATGCRKPVYFPSAYLPDAAAAVGAYRAYDADGDGRADVFHYAGGDGRVNAIGLARDDSGQEKVDLDSISPGQCRHLVLILDGFGYDIVRQYYDVGGLRLFHPPSRVVAPYPTLTDLCLADALGLEPCRGFEAEYYDVQARRIRGGSADYVAGKNEPYNALMQYRADMVWDAIGYLWPWEVFGKEVNDAKRRFDRGKDREFRAYFVSSAGVSTCRGAAGQIDCLQRIEQFVNQVIWETRGQTKVTLLSDHGHSYTPAEPIALEEYLRSKGWRVVDRLAKEQDVAYVRFGLETYACFGTAEPAALAADLIDYEGVELASFVQGDGVVVLAPRGARAVIREKGGHYAYGAVSGDPLKLRPILEKLSGDSAGFYSADDLLAATFSHTYPAPLQRLWRAHHDVARNIPDVIVSLENRFYSGSDDLGRMVNVASTHGGMNYANSVTFIMSTAGPLPPFMRSADIPQNLGALFAAPWPMHP